MPYKANEARRHRIPRARYRVTNWADYDRALQRRGSLTVWVMPEALAAWQPSRTGGRGRPRRYSEVAIETGHLPRLAFGVPDHTTFSRRSPGRRSPRRWRRSDKAFLLEDNEAALTLVFKALLPER